MKLWPIAAIGLSCLLSSGCRTDPAIQLLERDNRRLEDEIYRLRACLDDYQSGTIASETESVTTKPRHRDRAEESDSSRSNDLPPGASRANPSVEGDFEKPENEIQGIPSRSNTAPPRGPTPANRPGAFHAPRDSRAMPGIEPAGPALRGASDDDPVPPRVPAENTSYISPPKGDSYQAVQIVLHDQLCTASDADGLRVVFEARDRRDRRIDAPAAVSVVLIDPALVPRSGITPPEARIARWDYPADAVASMFRKVGGGNAIYIEAPWPDKAPEQKRLLLFVRYTTRDGRKLQNEKGVPLVIRPPEDRTTRNRRPERLQPAVEESTGPVLAEEEPAVRRERDDAPPADVAATSAEDRRDSPRTATRLQRPVWSPDRR